MNAPIPTAATISVDASKPVHDVEVIYGHDASKMTDTQFFDALRRVEKEIASLKEIKAKSVVIKARIQALKASRARIVALLDTRFGE